jgi:hypothetical protein
LTGDQKILCTAARVVLSPRAACGGCFSRFVKITARLLVGVIVMTLMQKLLKDVNGLALSTELILLMMILVFGVIAGNVSLRDAVNQEVADTGLAINNIDQSYSYAGNTNAVTGDTVAGSTFDDESDVNDGADTANTAPAGLLLELPAAAAGGE